MPEAAQLFYTRMAELADASDLSFDASACGFDSHFEYQILADVAYLAAANDFGPFV